MNRRIVPEPIARQPWEDADPAVPADLLRRAVLYSAGQAAMQPWALPTDPLRVFLVMARRHRRLPARVVQAAAYPVYRRDL
jgi:rod shape determining protein RodA